MDNNLTEKELINKIKEIWLKNKKSEDIVDYCEILLKQTGDIDVEIYLIYLNTLVNLKKCDKAFKIIDDNKQLGEIKEIISFKIKLLFFLKRYEECETYINSVELDGDNEKLAQKTLSLINGKKKIKETPVVIESKGIKEPEGIKEFERFNEESVLKEKAISLSKEDNIKKDVKEQIIKKIEKESIKPNLENQIIKEQETEEIPKRDNSKIQNNNKAKTKSKTKIILPILIILLLVVGVGAFVLNKKNSDIVINTSLNLSSQEEIKQYKSRQENISYELPVGDEFEFISTQDSNIDRDLYVTYKVSDENIATITKDGFFKGKNLGTVDVLTLNKKKVVNKITVNVIEKKILPEDEVTYDILPTDEIREVLKNYERDYVRAVNEGNYSLIEKYLVKDGPLAKEHMTNIKKFHDDGIREELKSFEFVSIDEIASGEYIANIFETISIIKNGEEKVKEFDSFYNIRLQDNGEYLIYEMQIKEITEK